MDTNPFLSIYFFPAANVICKYSFNTCTYNLIDALWTVVSKTWDKLANQTLSVSSDSQSTSMQVKHLLHRYAGMYLTKNAIDKTCYMSVTQKCLDSSIVARFIRVPEALSYTRNLDLLHTITI